VQRNRIARFPRVVKNIKLFVQVKSHCLEAVSKGALIVLRHLYDTYKGFSVIVQAVARVIASMSVHTELHSAIFSAG
jgi:hypothetical protein